MVDLSPLALLGLEKERLVKFNRCRQLIMPILQTKIKHIKKSNTCSQVANARGGNRH